MNDNDTHVKADKFTKLAPASQALPQIDRFTGRLFSGLIAVIVVIFVVTLGMAAYRYLHAP